MKWRKNWNLSNFDTDIFGCLCLVTDMYNTNFFSFRNVTIKCRQHRVGDRGNLIIWNPSWLKSVAIWVISKIILVPTCISFVIHINVTKDWTLDFGKDSRIWYDIDLQIYNHTASHLNPLHFTFANVSFSWSLFLKGFRSNVFCCSVNAQLTPSLSDIRSLRPAMGEPHQSVSPHCSRPVHLPSPQRAWLEYKSIATKSLIGWRSGCPTERMRRADGKRHTVQTLGKTPWPETLRENGSCEEIWEIMKRFSETCCLLTPAQTQKALADESGPDLSCHCHVGLPGLCEDPAERCQKEEVQEGCRHGADTLLIQEKKGHRLIYPLAVGSNWASHSQKCSLQY